MGTLDIIIIIIGAVTAIVGAIFPIFLFHESTTLYDKYNKISAERRGMKKHYFRFNYLEKGPYSLSDYNFKYYDTDYAWYIYETLYNSRKNQTLNIHGSEGVTVIEIKDKQIRFVSSPCPGKTCIACGAVHRPNMPIVCLPNRVSAYITGKAEFDAISR